MTTAANPPLQPLPVPPDTKNPRHEAALSWAERCVEFLEGPIGLKCLLGLLLLDILTVITAGILETSFITSERHDCEAHVKTILQTCVASHGSEPRSLSAAPEGLSGNTVCAENHHYGNHSLHDAEIALARISIAILVLFLIEQMLLLRVLGLKFFRHHFHVLDLCVIIITLALELATLTLPLGGLLVIARIWRFAHTGHGVVEACENIGKVAPAEPELELPTFLEQLRLELPASSWEAHAAKTGTPLSEAESALLARLAASSPELMLHALARLVQSAGKEVS
mmetsp:Transcript_81137/g.173585  ORF Transcript_81137/g.173585 Transcript_81137/m.173585 type:complete len:283 (+) Transcript_81137:91-939(+)